jgi:hypothetical protein
LPLSLERQARFRFATLSFARDVGRHHKASAGNNTSRPD